MSKYTDDRLELKNDEFRVPIFSSRNSLPRPGDILCVSIQENTYQCASHRRGVNGFFRVASYVRFSR